MSEAHGQSHRIKCWVGAQGYELDLQQGSNTLILFEQVWEPAARSRNQIHIWLRVARALVPTFLQIYPSLGAPTSLGISLPPPFPRGPPYGNPSCGTIPSVGPSGHSSIRTPGHCFLGTIPSLRPSLSWGDPILGTSPSMSRMNYWRQTSLHFAEL